MFGAFIFHPLKPVGPSYFGHNVVLPQKMSFFPRLYKLLLKEETLNFLFLNYKVPA